MADYHYDQRRGYGHPQNNQRDAAFSNIFGAAPPPGRSQTMTSRTKPSTAAGTRAASVSGNVSAAFSVGMMTETMATYLPASPNAHKRGRSRDRREIGQIDMFFICSSFCAMQSRHGR